MIGKAICEHYQLEENESNLFINWSKKVHPEVPFIRVIHEDRPMLKLPEELRFTKETYDNKKIIFLVRDPRDVIVSSYFEMNKRAKLFGKNPYEKRSPFFDGNIKEIIDQKQGGFDTIIQYYNIWAKNRHIPAGFLLVKYEDMRADPTQQLRRVIDFIGLPQIDSQTLAIAVEFASFDHMRDMEKQGKYSSGMLNPENISDKESYKTRRGKIQGYYDYFNDIEIAQLNQKMLSLDDFFGYII